MTLACSKEKSSIEYADSVKKAGDDPVPCLCYGRFGPNPSGGSPQADKFCNYRFWGDCLYEVVIIAEKPEGIDYGDFKGDANGDGDISSYLNDPLYVSFFQLDRLQSDYFNGLLNGTYRIYIHSNEGDNMDYLCVIDANQNVHDLTEDNTYMVVPIER